MNKRILLKISGEQLKGKHESGFDVDSGIWLAEEVKELRKAGKEVVIIVGGGNMVRGAETAGNGIKRVTADQMGMLSGLINAMAMTDLFEANGVPTRCISNIYVEQVAENFSFRLAEKHLENGRVLIVAGGTGRPYSTHDSAAVLVGLELDCDLVIKTTKVDGVYDKDPEKHSDAKVFKTLSYQQALENPSIKVMDKSAMGLAMEHEMPVVVCSLYPGGNILKVATGEEVGTRIS